MIKLKGDILTVTGKDEKLLRRYAKEAKMTPKKFLIETIKKIAERYTFLDKDILIEKINEL
jgi:hypothetical protein